MNIMDIKEFSSIFKEYKERSITRVIELEKAKGHKCVYDGDDFKCIDFNYESNEIIDVMFEQHYRGDTETYYSNLTYYEFNLTDAEWVIYLGKIKSDIEDAKNKAKELEREQIALKKEQQFKNDKIAREKLYEELKKEFEK